MKAILVVLYSLILQLGIAVIVLGIVTYLRHRKESLKYFILFMVSLQLSQMRLLLNTCVDYAGNKSFLLRGLIGLFQIPGLALMIYVLGVFPFFVKGKKPGKTVKLCAVLLSLTFVIDNFLALMTGLDVFFIINRLIVLGSILYAVIFILSFAKDIGHPAMRRVMIYLCGISMFFVPFQLMEFLHNSSFRPFQSWLFQPLPVYFLILCCSGLYLFKKYFNIPSYVDPEQGRLSERFIQDFSITEREAEIIMLLREGKTYKEIAEQLTIAYKTVDAHIQNIYSKTVVNSRKQLLNLIETSRL